MQIFTQSQVDKFVPLSVFADAPLRLAPEDHPNGEFSNQHAMYNAWWASFKGYTLNKRNSDNIELYPVKLNIVYPSVINHAAVLLGQYVDHIVQFGSRQGAGIDKESGKKMADACNLLWAINKGDSTLLEQSIYQQVFGGCFYKVAWMPTRKKWPIRYVTVDPRAVFPIWDSDDPDRLVSVEVMHQVPKATAALRYRVDVSKNRNNEDDYVSVHEKWTEAEYEVTVDGQPARWPDGSQMAGPNPFLDPVMGHPIVPFVYIPRIRSGDFWGDSLVPSITGALKEVNNNLAHLNEGLADAMHQPVWVKNRPKGTQGLSRPRNEVLDLGMTQHGNNDPEMGRLDGAEITDAMKDYVVNDLIKLTREAQNMPDVAFGKTDTSIRSALTLKYMMWPAINVGLRYRLHMSAGFKQMAYYAFVIAYTKRQFNQSVNGVQSIGMDPVDEKMLETTLLGHKTNWPPMLPDDRAEQVNEMIQRLSAGIISPTTAILRLDGPDEVEEELALIEEFQQQQLDKQMEQAEAQAEGEAERADEQADKQLDRDVKLAKEKEAAKPKDRTTRAQASGGRKSSPSK